MCTGDWGTKAWRMGRGGRAWEILYGRSGGAGWDKELRKGGTTHGIRKVTVPRYGNHKDAGAGIRVMGDVLLLLTGRSKSRALSIRV